MPRVPRDRLDSTLAFVRGPYGFISSKCRRHDSDLFQTRLMFRSTICMYGREAAELFYDSDRFIRTTRLPALPRSRFVLSHARAVA